MVKGRKVGMRSRLNGGARRLGNMIYDGLGDVLTCEISPKKMLGIGLVGLAVGGSGCSPAGDAFADHLAVSGAEAVVYHGVGRAVNPNQVEVNVGGGGYVMSRPKPRIVMKEWRDYNGDKIDSPNEISRDVDGPVNMSKVGISVDIGHYWSNRPIPVSYTILNSNGKMVAEKDCFQEGLTIFRGSLSFGRYTIVARQGSDIHLVRDFVVTR